MTPAEPLDDAVLSVALVVIAVVFVAAMVSGCKALGLGADEGRQVKVTTAAGSIETRGPWVPDPDTTTTTTVTAQRVQDGDRWHVEYHFACPAAVSVAATTPLPFPAPSSSVAKRDPRDPRDAGTARD